MFMRVWKDTWQWLLSTRMGWIIAVIGCGVMGGIFVGNSLLARALAGLAGAIIAIVLILGVVYLIHLLFVTPNRLRKEQRRKYIENNASYIPFIFGNPIKKKYTKILSTLESLIKIENEFTDSVVGRHQLT